MTWNWVIYKFSTKAFEDCPLQRVAKWFSYLPSRCFFECLSRMLAGSFIFASKSLMLATEILFEINFCLINASTDLLIRTQELDNMGTTVRQYDTDTRVRQYHLVTNYKCFQDSTKGRLGPSPPKNSQVYPDTAISWRVYRSFLKGILQKNIYKYGHK